MHVKKATLINSGPTEKLELTFQFNDDSSPKSTILLGKNGSGKTNFLSSLADAIVELQASKFNDVMPSNNAGERNFYRILGSSTTHIGKTGEATAVKFEHNHADFVYLSRSGPIQDGAAELLTDYSPLNAWQDNLNSKQIHQGADTLESCFKTGSYTFFPSNRYEEPWWLAGREQKFENIRFSQSFSKNLRKPFIVNRSFEDLKPWLADVILDQAIDGLWLLGQLQGEANLPNIAFEQKLLKVLNDSVGSHPTLLFINHIFSTILKTRVSIIRSGRGNHERKIQIYLLDENKILPSLDSLSTGQQNLLAIFLTILRYGDTGSKSTKLEEISGISIIDEIDAHLHADLQYEILPNLISLFPNVQFIISSHAPLFILGMSRKFADKCVLIDIPSGLTIDAERFNEFERSVQIIRDTQLFDNYIKEAVSKSIRPLILCEGETDPKYFETACELLGYTQLKNLAEFSSIGSKSDLGSLNSGTGALDNARKMFFGNPSLLTRKVACIYDCDAKPKTFKTDETSNLLTLTLPINEENSVTDSGIENMLPSTSIEPAFISEKITENKNKKIIETYILKNQLCNYLCHQKRNANDFNLFAPTLQKLCDFFAIPYN